MRYFFLGILFLIIQSPGLAQGELFPVAKNGKWGLVDSSGQFILSYKYDHIDYFPRADKYVYNSQGKDGIIDGNGTVISEPTYQQIVPIDTNWTISKLDDKWGLFARNEIHFTHQFDSISEIKKDLFFLFNGEKAAIYQGVLKKKTASSFRSTSLFNDQFLLAKDSSGTHQVFWLNPFHFITNQVNKVEKMGYGYALLTKTANMQLVALKNGALVGAEMETIAYQFGQLFYCTNKGEHFLFQADENKYYPISVLDFVDDFDFPYLTYTLNGRQGVWNVSTGKQIITPDYEGLKRIPEGFLVTQFNRFGIINNRGDIVLPVSYKSIDIHDKLYIAQTNQNYGVLSKSGNTIVPFDYEKIKVYADNIKCYSADAITVIKLDENGGYKSQKTYDEYMSISIGKEQMPRQRSVSTRFGGPASNDRNLEKFGWFRPVIERPSGDSIIEVRGKWGLRDTVDSIAIRPQFAQIDVNSTVGLTKAYRKKTYAEKITDTRQLIVDGLGIALSKKTNAIFNPSFKLVDQKARKLLCKKSYLSLKVDDFEDYHLARGYDLKGLILVEPSGKVARRNLSFYGFYNEDILRIAEGGKPVFHDQSKNTTASSTAGFFKVIGAAQWNVERDESYLQLDGAKWYFLDKTGKQLNDEPFDYAKEFVSGTAIVGKNGRFGVIDTAMNIIVPIEYHSIERRFINGKPFFEVRNKVNQHYIYDRSTGTLAKTKFSQLKSFNKGTWFAKQGSSKWALIDTNLRSISNFEFDRIRPFENGYATITKRGKKTLIDERGNEILPYYKCKKLRVIGFDYYAVENSKGNLIINLVGDTLLEARDCKEVLDINTNYLVYLNRIKQIEILGLNAPFSPPKKAQLLSYSLKDELLLVRKKGKKRLYSIKREKYLSKDLPNIEAIGEGTLIYKGENKLFGFLSFNGDTLCQPIFKELAAIKNGWAYARGEKSRGLVNKNGEYLFDFPVFRVNKLGDRYTINTSEGMGLIEADGTLLIAPKYTSITPYNGNFYKCTYKNKTRDLYDLTGKRINDKAYRDIKGISAQSLIVNHQRLDYLYTGQLNKSLSFQKIKPVSARLFLLDERWHRGMYNADGKLVVPVRYHTITIRRDHFQVSFFNSFGYFAYNGKILADPYNVQ